MSWPQKTVVQLECKIAKISKSDMCLTAPDIRHHLQNFYDISLSNTTVKRRLCVSGLDGRVARRKPLISLKNRCHQQQWFKECKDQSNSEWDKIIWSNEGVFFRFGNDARQYVRRRPGEEFDSKCTIPPVKEVMAKIQCEPVKKK